MRRQLLKRTREAHKQGFSRGELLPSDLREALLDESARKWEVGLEEIVYTGSQESLSVNLSGVWYRFPKDEPQPVTGLQAKKLLKQTCFRRYSTYERLKNAFKRGQSVPVYIRRDSGLGDVLMLIPALRKMKETFPNIDIVLSTAEGFFPLLEDLPCISKLHDKEKFSTLEWDSFYSITNLNMAVERMTPHNRLMHRIDQFGMLLGVEVSDHSIEIPLRPEWEVDAEDFLRREGWNDEPLVVIQLKGAVESRTPTLEWWKPIVEILTGRGDKVVFVGHESEGWDGPGIIRADGIGLNLGVVAALLKRSLLIGPDSGMAHLSCSVGGRVIALMSTVPAQLRYSYCSNILAIQPLVKCYPCYSGGCAKKECFRAITANHLLEAIEYMESEGDIGCLIAQDTVPWRTLKIEAFPPQTPIS